MKLNQHVFEAFLSKSKHYDLRECRISCRAIVLDSIKLSTKCSFTNFIMQMWSDLDNFIRLHSIFVKITFPIYLLPQSMC